MRFQMRLALSPFSLPRGPCTCWVPRTYGLWGCASGGKHPPSPQPYKARGTWSPRLKSKRHVIWSTLTTLLSLTFLLCLKLPPVNVAIIKWHMDLCPTFSAECGPTAGGYKTVRKRLFSLLLSPDLTSQRSWKVSSQLHKYLFADTHLQISHQAEKDAPDPEMGFHQPPQPQLP